ncbi:SPOR domain-containing protein [Acinetobacter modestus]|uniref:SPOR domain-containing protein n=1 Tax=Acinetobacter modestus TaxID=1776740 RepID=UPI001F4A7B42|nr:SPOR domain-containing protein [Acinetobacter modestus]MCH7329712.1 SPOR domain-containing protein [Acinetobacter modestus]
MSMNNKQRWMGGVVLLGGGVLLAALLLKGNDEIGHDKTQTAIAHPIPKTEPKTQTAQSTQEGEMVSLQPLAVDVETEKRLLEEQRRSREKAVAEQEARAADFLKMQQEAEAAAARKAAEEYAAINARRLAEQESSDNIPPELGEDDKAKTQRAAEEKNKLDEKKKLEQQKVDQQKSDTDKKLAEDKRKAEAEKKLAEEKRKAEAEKKAEEDKRKAEAEKKAAEEKRKTEAEKKTADEKKRKADAEKKAEAEKARDLMENGDKKWMVQVALAANQANADAVVSKLRAKGYKVTTSPTSKGIRIMVGPSKDRDVADAARKKITSDESLNMKSAWVIDWVPLDQR